MCQNSTALVPLFSPKIVKKYDCRLNACIRTEFVLGNTSNNQRNSSARNAGKKYLNLDIEIEYNWSCARTVLACNPTCNPTCIPSAVSPMPNSNPSAPQLRALLVEDSPTSQKLMRNLLESLGCSVTLAKNGREAVTKFVENEFDVVLMDVQMPIMDGIAATQIIRQHEFARGGHTPIIAVTAGMDRESCMEAGMDDYLVKPIESATLRESLDRVSNLNSKA